MKKSLTSTIALVVFLAVVIGWYFIYEQKVRPENTQLEEKAKQFITLDTGDISEFELTRRVGAPTDGQAIFDTDKSKTPSEDLVFKLKKTGEDWSLVEPIETDADSGAIRSMLSTLVTTKHDRVVEEKPASLDKYGLTNPEITISVKKDASSPAQLVLIGANTPVGSNLFVKTSASEAVYRAPQALRSAFEKNLKDLRNKNIFSISRVEVTEAEIVGPAGSLVMKRGDKDQWTLARQDFPADNDEWNKTLTALVDARATEFPSENPASLAPFGMNNPTYKVELVAGKKEPAVRLSFGLSKMANKHYAKRTDKPIIYEVSEDLYKKVAQPWMHYRNMRLALFDRFSVARVKLERSGHVLELLKENGAWTLPTEPGVKLDSAKVDTLLTGLQDTRVEKFLADKTAMGIKDPTLTIRLYEKKQDKEEETTTLTFGKAVGASVLGERKGISAAFQIRAEDFRKLNVTKASLVENTVKEDEKKVPEKKSE